MGNYIMISMKLVLHHFCRNTQKGKQSSWNAFAQGLSGNHSFEPAGIAEVTKLKKKVIKTDKLFWEMIVLLLFGAGLFCLLWSPKKG
ncbi:hypothetical protein [Pedobacter roseus]|uniref:Uncharacterized protein n=1 Tax=Pedobacter roseus TaxID=336820 RepID=A0A7G9QKW4_9SPHI|nr:hypothetical protein [Pedobacter roseus]QNN43989.1 hypothetical protein H9L23_07885 [Pedobacter roseus]